MRMLQGIVVAGLVAALCPNASRAETGGMRAEEIAFFEVPVVVTAARRPQRLTEAPSTVDVITAEEITASGALTLQDVLRMVAGIDLRNYGTKTEIYIRGVTGLDRVLCLVDGRRINSAFDGSFRADLPLASVSRIEIVKGPGSALYGPNAFGGVINIITKNGHELDGGSLAVGAGQDGTSLVDFAIGGKGDPFEGILTYRRYDTDGQRIVNGNDDLMENDLFGKVSWGGLTLSAGHDWVDRGIQGREGRESPDDRLVDTTDFVDLSLQKEWGAFGLGMRGYVNRRTNDYILNRRPMTYDSEVTAAESMGSWIINAEHSIVAGIDYRRDVGGMSGSNHEARNTGLFLEYESRPLRALIVTLGGRWDTHSVYEDVFTPRLSGIYRIGDRTTVRASYGEAFRAPSIQDLYVDFYLSPTVHMVGNPDLKPERLTTYEIGANHSFAPFLSGNMNLFLTEAKELIQIQQSFVGGEMVNQAVNIGEASIRGAEIGAKGKAGRSIDLYAGYSYLEGEDENGKELLYIPASKVQAGIVVRPFDWVMVDLGARYVGVRQGYDYDTRSEVSLDDYVVADASVQMSWRTVSLQLRVSNIFDESYQETVGYPMPRRSYLATASWSF